MIWNKGLTKETDERVKKIANKKTGKYHSRETIEKIRKSRLGKSSSLKGRTYEEIMGEEKAKELRDFQSKTRKGKKSWNNGLTKETDERVRKGGLACSKALKGRIPYNKGREREDKSIGYGESWRQIRKSILERDNNKCLICSREEYLCIHHCLPNKIYQSNDESELKTVCKLCHEKIQPLENKEWVNFCRLVKNDQLNDAYILGLRIFENVREGSSNVR